MEWSIGMQMRRRVKQTIPLKDRLQSFARDLRKKALSMAPGGEQDDLLRKASQAETTSHIDEWANSAGLQSPK
jgi:hypothetical protein